MVVIYWQDEPQFSVECSKDQEDDVGEFVGAISDALSNLERSSTYVFDWDCGDLKKMLLKAGLVVSDLIPIDQTDLYRVDV